MNERLEHLERRSRARSQWRQNDVGRNVIELIEESLFHRAESRRHDARRVPWAGMIPQSQIGNLPAAPVAAAILRISPQPPGLHAGWLPTKTHTVLPRSRADSTCRNSCTLGTKSALARVDVHPVGNELRGDPSLRRNAGGRFRRRKDGETPCAQRSSSRLRTFARSHALPYDRDPRACHAWSAAIFCALQRNSPAPPLPQNGYSSRDDRRPGDGLPGLARQTPLKVNAEVMPPLPSFARGDASAKRWWNRAVENRKRRSQP